MRKFTNKIFMGAATFIVAVSMIFGTMTTTYGLSDGAYVVKASGHYVHPKTGKVIDSGNNPGIGQGMVEGVVERTALVEKVGNKTYVTIGMGLMSNITKVRVYTERNGSYTGVSITKTGSFKKNGDYVYQYRFQMNDTGDIISPALYVEPMGREVKFFIKLHMSTAKKGTGAYKSLLTGKNAGKAGNQGNANSASNSDGKGDSGKSSDKNSNSADGKKDSSEDKKSDEENKDKEKSQDENKNSDSKEEKNTKSKKTGKKTKIIIIGAVVVMIIAGCLVYIFKFRGKK